MPVCLCVHARKQKNLPTHSYTAHKKTQLAQKQNNTQNIELNEKINTQGKCFWVNLIYYTESKNWWKHLLTNPLNLAIHYDYFISITHIMYEWIQNITEYSDIRAHSSCYLRNSFPQNLNEQLSVYGVVTFLDICLHKVQSPIIQSTVPYNTKYSPL